MKKLLGGLSVLILAGALGFAQTNPDSSNPGTAGTQNRAAGQKAPSGAQPSNTGSDNHGGRNNWGWIGLLGLLGLGGLSGRRDPMTINRDSNINDINRRAA